MRKITRQQAQDLKNKGYIFKPHNLYQSELTAVLVEISPNNFRAFQVIPPKSK